MIVVQKLSKEVEDRYSLAYKYYGILSIINDMNLVKRDIQLLSYSILMDAPVSEIKEKFVEEFNSSMPTVGNIISKLYKLHVLQKNKRVITINPVLLINFESNLIMNLIFKHKEPHGDKG